MYNIKKTLKLLSYITNPMSQEGINILYSANNIKYEKCELYSDFVQSLLSLIFDTYLGDDFTNNEQQVIHFKWCWDKNISNFKEEGVTINSKELSKYFKEFVFEEFYNSNNKADTNNISKIWLDMLKYDGVKSKLDIDTLIEIYILFEKANKK